MENNNLNDDREKIASRLKEARVMAGLSQAQAADRLGLQRPAISEIESAKRKVSAEEIIQFASLYRVDTSWLLLQDKENEQSMSQHLKFAARELEKLSEDDIRKLIDVLKILPKK
ncbi:MAG: XRE family transcriptional regulator [Sphingobacteriales bacterium]|nr:MAG: XRE family transcriptional regulator [Sphingobacteriales bacterium]